MLGRRRLDPRSHRSQAAVVLMALILGAVAYAESQAPSASPGKGRLMEIAFLKASNPVEDAHFGCGGTLTGHAGNASAISRWKPRWRSAPLTRTVAPRISSSQNDHSLYSSGAVHVFTRKGNALTQQAYIVRRIPAMRQLDQRRAGRDSSNRPLRHYESSGATASTATRMIVRF